MSNSSFQLAGFLAVCFVIFYGGAFIYFLLYSRLIKKRKWGISIASAFLWMILYVFLSTVVADIGAAGWSDHHYIVTGMIVFIVALPYVAIARIWIKYRRAEQGAAANP